MSEREMDGSSPSISVTFPLISFSDLSGIMLMQQQQPSGAVVQQQVTLRQLVGDLIGESGEVAAAAGGQGVTITTNCIRKAVENSARSINKDAILANLYLVMESEVEAGLFSKVGADTYSVMAQNYLGGGGQHKAAGRSTSPPALIIHPQMQSACSHVQQQVPAVGHQPQSLLRPPPSKKAKTEEEQKNDLINNTISKLQEKFAKEGAKTSKSVGGGAAAAIIMAKTPKKEPLYVTLREKRMANISKRNAEAAAAAVAAATINGASSANDDQEERDALARPLLEAVARRPGRPGRKPKGNKAKRLKEQRLTKNREAVVADVPAEETESHYSKKEEWKMEGAPPQPEDVAAAATVDGANVGRLGSKREKVSVVKFWPSVPFVHWMWNFSSGRDPSFFHARDC